MQPPDSGCLLSLIELECRAGSSFFAGPPVAPGVSCTLRRSVLQPTLGHSFGPNHLINDLGDESASRAR